jgi:hypothetical protein
VADNPLSCVALGTGKVLDELDLLKKWRSRPNPGEGPDRERTCAREPRCDETARVEARAASYPR